MTLHELSVLPTLPILEPGAASESPQIAAAEPLRHYRDGRAVLIDRFGRRHNNLRLSVTDRCNIRCTYCMPEEVTFLERSHLLTFEELTRVATVASRLGIDKLRLTGGEPLVRRELPKLVAMLHAIPGIREIALTTNGVLLDRFADDLFAAGLDRLNISLDTLDAEQFRQITRRDEFDRVLRGIAAAHGAGFRKTKLNAVAMKGVNEDQVVPLAHFCRERDIELRFIEFMPLEADHTWRQETVLTAADVRDLLARAGLATEPLPAEDPSAPATEYAYTDGRGKLGIIASVTEPFCGTCNRLRLTAEGKLRNCLFSLEEADVKARLRGGAADEEIADVLRRTVNAKWAGHLIGQPDFVRPERTMHAIGG